MCKFLLAISVICGVRGQPTHTQKKHFDDGPAWLSLLVNTNNKSGDKEEKKIENSNIAMSIVDLFRFF